MNNAETYSVGNDKNTRKRKTEEIVSTALGVRRMDAKTKDAQEIEKDRRKSVPLTMLPMVY